MIGEICILNSNDIKGFILGVISGIVSSIITTMIFNLRLKIKNEKKELENAIQGYGSYGQQVVRLLKNFYKHEAEKEKDQDKIQKDVYQIEKLIDDYPYFIGFHYTESDALKGMKRIIDDINYDITEEKLSAKEAHEYIKKLQSQVLKLFDARYKFRIK